MATLAFLKKNRISYLALKSMHVLQADRTEADPAVSLCSWKRIWTHVYLLCQQYTGLTASTRLTADDVPAVRFFSDVDGLQATQELSLAQVKALLTSVTLDMTAYIALYTGTVIKSVLLDIPTIRQLLNVA